MAGSKTFSHFFLETINNIPCKTILSKNNEHNLQELTS